jgi:uncharacterized protein YbaP (TraB family)
MSAPHLHCYRPHCGAVDRSSPQGEKDRVGGHAGEHAQPLPPARTVSRFALKQFDRPAVGTVAIQIFAALFAVLLLFISARAPALAAEPTLVTDATPAMWTVEKDGKKLYLFGSMHLLPAQVKWRRPEIDDAIAASSVFVFEAPVGGNSSSAMSKFIETGGKLKDGQTLQDILPAELYAKVEDASWKVNYPPQMLKTFRPWFAAVSLELFTYIKAGFSTYYGVDYLIEKNAQDEGKKIDYLETVEEQLSFFSRLDRKVEISYLRETVRSIMEEPNSALELINAWSSGKPEQMIGILEAAFDKIPVLRSQLLVARNKNWVPKIEAMLKSGDTHFVTVGVGHLVGPDSVIAQLKAKGYKITGP